MEEAQGGRFGVIIRGGQVALPGEGEFRERDIFIDGETIGRIGSGLEEKVDEEIVDARGMVVLPGGIDPHVHFDDPGYSHREDFLNGSRSAAAGGITAVIDMPCTSVPPVTSLENFHTKLREIERKAVVDFGLYGGICAQSFEQPEFSRNIEELSKVVIGFKTYFISGMESFGRLDHYQFRVVLEEVSKLGLPVLLHAEDYDYVQSATAQEMNMGNGPLNYYRSRPETAEMIAALAAIQIAEETGADLHIVHIGTAGVGELLRGRRVSGETAPHYLAFDLDDFHRIGSLLKCTPPLKSPGSKEKLWELLADGSVSFVASDHAPCPRKEKHTGSIWTDYAGIPGSGTLLPYVFSEGFMKRRLTLQRLVQVTSENAARRYGLFHKKGSIEIGKDGDFVLIDPSVRWTVRGAEFYSKGKETPFEGMRLEGKIMKTILRGRVVYTAGEGIVGTPGGGKLLKRVARRGGAVRKSRRG